ncbi:MAG TPA: hypothetical protein VKU80_13345, partial [Planctomycetota bacterium]|nr:hypothetical protein [Planctomycetota bacterium]
MTGKTQVMRIKLQKGRHLVKRREVWYLETCIRGHQERFSLETPGSRRTDSGSVSLNDQKKARLSRRAG